MALRLRGSITVPATPAATWRDTFATARPMEAAMTVKVSPPSGPDLLPLDHRQLSRRSVPLRHRQLTRFVDEHVGRGVFGPGLHPSNLAKPVTFARQAS